jgi:hypothetical protein
MRASQLACVQQGPLAVLLDAAGVGHHERGQATVVTFSESTGDAVDLRSIGHRWILGFAQNQDQRHLALFGADP